MNESILKVLKEIPNLSIERYKGYICAHYGDDISPSYTVWNERYEEVEGGCFDMTMFPFRQWVDSLESEV